MNKLSVIVPVYNEAENIEIFLNRTISTLVKINTDYEIILLLILVRIKLRN